MSAELIPSSLSDGSVSLRDGTLLIVLADEAALNAVDELERVSALASERGSHAVVLNVAALPDIGNDDLIALCALARQLQHDQVTITIIGLDSRARSLLEIVRLHRVTIGSGSVRALIGRAAGVVHTTGE
jgi:anti-anti-sigma regulatory factor